MSAVVAAYPAMRGQTRLRQATKSWLVARLSFGAWVRVSGLVDAEWDFLIGHLKEDATTQFVKSFIKPGSVFVDVGSNVGYFSLLAASLDAKVVAYEPTPAIFNRINENFALNGYNSIALVNAAVADKRGALVLYQSLDDPEANNLFGDGKDCIEVLAIALDEDLSSRGVTHVDLLKIDAEGAEPMVLDGAVRLLASPDAPTILLEVNPIALRRANSSSSDVLSRLEIHGYSFTEVERFAYKGETVLNIVASPPSFPEPTAVS